MAYDGTLMLISIVTSSRLRYNCNPCHHVNPCAKRRADSVDACQGTRMRAQYSGPRLSKFQRSKKTLRPETREKIACSMPIAHSAPKDKACGPDNSPYHDLRKEGELRNHRNWFGVGILPMIPPGTMWSFEGGPEHRYEQGPAGGTR
jgi:hypothetical protein